MIYGYARGSTDGQNVAVQVAALTAPGAEKVFREVASGAKTDRAQLARSISRLAPGDLLLVTRLDRLARSTGDLLNILTTIAERQTGFLLLGRRMGRHDHTAWPPYVDHSGRSRSV